MVSLAFLAGGCSNGNASSVEQDKIYTSYLLIYDDTDKSLSAAATFNLENSGGTYLTLDSKSSVAFDGQPMTLGTGTSSQSVYQLTLSNLAVGQIWDSHSFIYQDNLGNAYSNSITLPVLPSAQAPASLSL